MWHVYILECNNGHLYTGMTNDLTRRVKQHLSGQGGRFTKTFGVKRLLYREECDSREDALRREIQIKRLSRDRKLLLISEI